MDEFEFKVITPELVDRAYDFLWENFFPDEPLCSSVGIRRGLLVDAMVKKILASGQSIAALSKDGLMVGVRGGEIVKADDRVGRFMESGLVEKAIMSYARFSGSIDDTGALVEVGKLLEFNTYRLIDTIGAKKIYKGFCVCTSREARGKGLGTKLIAKSMELAKAAGCEYVYLMATGNFSNKIFDKLGFESRKELVYSEYVDEEGQPKLKRTGVHIKCQVRLKTL